MCVHTSMHMHTGTRLHICTHKFTQMHARVQTHAHTHMHTHTQVPFGSCSNDPWNTVHLLEPVCSSFPGVSTPVAGQRAAPTGNLGMIQEDATSGQEAGPHLGKAAAPSQGVPGSCWNGMMVGGGQTGASSRCYRQSAEEAFATLS